jgi:hypothetical protein
VGDIALSASTIWSANVNPDEPQLAPPDQSQLGLDVPLERVQRHLERERSFLAAQRNPGDIRWRRAHGEKY